MGLRACISRAKKLQENHSPRQGRGMTAGMTAGMTGDGGERKMTPDADKRCVRRVASQHFLVSRCETSCKSRLQSRGQAIARYRGILLGI